MNKWRDSCNRSQDSFKYKIDKFENSIQTLRAKIIGNQV